MRLSSADFEKIAEALSKLAVLEVTVREVEVAGHKLVLRKDGHEYSVVGITSGELSGAGANR